MHAEAQEQALLDEKLAEYREKGVSKIKLGLSDIDGVLRGKYISLSKFASIMRKQGGFCDCVFGWDVDDQLYDSGQYTGWHTGFPDTGFILQTDSERWLADENCPLFLGQFVNRDGTPHPLCPRTRLQQVLGKFSDRGLTVRAGFEYEFFVFDETPHTIREKHFQQLKPLTPGNFGYSLMRATTESELFSGLMDYLMEMDCELEGLHCETGPGVWEGALASAVGIAAADRASLMKFFSKVFMQKRGLIATFMAKWSMEYPGQSGHYHFSVADLADENQFFDATSDDAMSTMQRHAVGGLQQYLPEFLVMLAPTINSYTRLVKGAWAPTAATWGIENRTCGIRVIPGSASSQRIECRIGGADGNPYLVATAILGAALLGIEQALEPTSAIVGNAYDVQDSLPIDQQFPTNLRDAAVRFEQSNSARSMFGDEFVDHFAMTRLWESREYERHVNSWQLERYFEII